MCDMNSVNNSLETNSIAASIGDVLLNNKTLSISDRYYQHKYCRQLPKIPDDICQRVSFHSNRVCLISLAEDHPVMRKSIAKMNFKVSEKVDRLKNKVSGKSKRGAQKLSKTSIICFIECDDGTKYPVYSCINGKLLEINEKLLTDPNLLKIRPYTEGYIALLLPILSEYKESKNSMLTKEQYESS